MHATTRYSADQMRAAKVAITALSSELYEDEDVLLENPIAIVSKIHALGQAHPSLKADVSELLIGLKNKSITLEPPPPDADGIKIGLFVIKKFVKELVPCIADSEFKAVENFIDQSVTYRDASDAVDTLIRNADDYLDLPLTFAQQIQSFQTMGHFLTTAQVNEILGILFDRTFPAPSKEEQSIIPERTMDSLRQIAKKIHDRTSVITRAEVERTLYEETDKQQAQYQAEWVDLADSDVPSMRSYQILDVVREKIFHAHQKYKSLLLQSKSSDELLSIENKKSIPIAILSADLFTSKLVPEGSALCPDNPNDIPHQFEADLLTELTADGVTSTRGRNKTFRFYSSSGTDPFVIESPKTKKEGEKIIRDAEAFARKIMPSDATLDDINRMRNHILAFSSQHLPNSFVMPLIIEATQLLEDHETEASFTIASDTVQFFPVTKNGIIQKGQFKVVLESRIVMKVLIDDLSKSQKTLLTDLCVAAPAMIKVNAELTFKMEKKKEETTWTSSVSEVKKSYNLEKSISF